ncbi:sensor histidine kinase [Paenibacillus rhizoplanae]
MSVREEIAFIDMYLRIEKFRFRDKFDYTFEIDEQSLDYKNTEAEHAAAGREFLQAWPADH